MFDVVGSTPERIAGSTFMVFAGVNIAIPVISTTDILPSLSTVRIGGSSLLWRSGSITIISVDHFIVEMSPFWWCVFFWGVS